MAGEGSGLWREKKERRIMSTKTPETDDHKIALLVNAITEELKPFTKTQSLRARVSRIVLEHLKPKAGTSCGRSANNLNQNKLKKYDHNRKRSEIS